MEYTRRWVEQIAQRKDKIYALLALHGRTEDYNLCLFLVKQLHTQTLMSVIDAFDLMISWLSAQNYDTENLRHLTDWYTE